MSLDDDSQLINSKQRPLIRIEHFKEKYLPLLFNSDPSKFNLAWINNVAMSPYLSVEIIDRDNNVIHVVPPLRRPINSTLNVGISNLINYAIAEQAIHPARGDLYLHQNLNQRLQFGDPRTDDIQEQWNQLLIDLGYGDMVVTKETINKPSTDKEYQIIEDNDW